MMASRPITAGIDKHVVTPTTTYDDKGYAVIGGRRLNNAQGRAYGTTTVTQILERSANAGAVFVASKLGQDPLYQYLRAFGFGNPTGIDLAGDIGQVEAGGELAATEVDQHVASRLGLAGVRGTQLRGFPPRPGCSIVLHLRGSMWLVPIVSA